MSVGRASEVLMSMHHRRKQRLSEGTYRQYMIDSEEPISEPTTSDGPKSRTDNKDSSVVISDSDDAELQEESILPKKRRRPPPHRKPLPVKRKLAQMTEEEQLALAVQMSQQEQAKPEEYTQEEEDELIKKAIEESLHSCEVPDILVSATEDELTSGASSSHEHCEKEPHSSKESKPSGEISAKSPVVRLQRLSQDIVESSSVILSPNCKDPISCIENCLQSAPSPCTSSNFIKASPAKELALSPVFPKKSPRPCKLIPCRLFQEISPSADRPVDDLDDQCTHCSESPQIDSLSMLPTSCSQGESLYQNDCGKTETFHTDKAKKLDCEKGIESSDCRAGKTNQSGGTVHYYWGVPFCPKGVDPSEYTKVILCQLEVYQKTLKSAQRQLLHKMDYGQPIHLTASSRKYFKEDTQGSVSQEDTEECVAEDDTRKPDEDETERDDNSDSQETQYLSSKRQKISQSPAQTGLENDHCSSSQDENDSVKMPFTQLQPSECAGVAPVAPGESAVSPTAVRNDRHLKEHPDIAQEEEITVCPETQPCPAKQAESDKEDQTDIMENSSDPQVSNSSDEDLVCLNKVYKNVACPMCGCNFSRTQIERHAAYCDGTKRQQEMAVLRPRNKLRRSHDSSAAVSITSSDSGKCEKCYLCKLLVPLKDYQAHVDNCLQTAMLETQGSQRLRSVKEYPERNCRLLSMLEHSESSLAETNGNAPEPSHLSPPREEHGAHFSSEHLNLSDSPIRSFVAISEATDCLVDFKKQFSRRPGSRGAGRRGKRRRM